MKEKDMASVKAKLMALQRRKKGKSYQGHSTPSDGGKYPKK